MSPNAAGAEGGVEAVVEDQASSDASGVVLRFNQAINERDLPALTGMMTDDHLLVTGAEDPVVGREACSRAWGLFFEMFPDYRNVFEDVRAQGSVVWVRGRSVCGDARLSGSAAWKAVVEGRRVREWHVDADTTAGWRRLDFDMEQLERRIVVDRYVAAYNAFDVEGMMATLHPRIVFRNVSAGTVNAMADGTGEFRALADRAATMFSERTLTIDAFSEHGERAIAEVSWEGVLAADIPGLGSSGDRLRLRGRSVFDFRDGLIVRLTDES